MIFNSPEIKIKFKTFDPFVLKNLAPLSAQKKYPSWFKDTPYLTGPI